MGPPPTQASPEPSPSSPATFGDVPLQDLLESLEVQEEREGGYLRESFKLWIRRNGNPCDTRREVLIRDAVDPPTVLPPCVIVGGAWNSLYDGLSFDDPRKLDVDHVVPLAEAWRSGAWEWSAERRSRFANDLEVTWALVAVSWAENRTKKDHDPALYLPKSASAHCGYVRMWIQVKVRWRLAVDERELAALRTTVAGCAPIRGERVPAQ